MIFSDPFKDDPFWASVAGKSSTAAGAEKGENELSAQELAAALARERERASNLERELVRDCTDP